MKRLRLPLQHRPLTRSLALFAALCLLLALACNAPVQNNDAEQSGPITVPTPTSAPVQPTQPPTVTPLVLPATATSPAPTNTPAATLVPAATATPEGTPPFPAGTLVATVNTSGLNIRRGPGVSYDIIIAVGRGTIVQLTGLRNEAGNWIQIRTQDGIIGWVNGRFLDSDIDFSTFDVSGG